MTLLLVNPFVVFEGMEAEFLSLWEQTNHLFAASSGYVSASLLKASAEQAIGQHPPFTHVNVAEWASAADYESALLQPALRPFVKRYRRVCTYQPGLYEIIR